VLAFLPSGLDHQIQRIRDPPVSLGGRVLVDHRGASARMADARHDLFECRTGLCGQRAACTP
jgi:hypothetical protein